MAAAARALVGGGLAAGRSILLVCGAAHAGRDRGA